MGKKREPTKQFICSFPPCEAAYNKQWKLDAHLCKHTGVKPFSCEMCDKSFASSYHLTRHGLVHSGLRPFPCTVEGCEDAFTTNSNRAKHISRFHDQESKRYVCKVEGCGLEFKKNKQLKLHMCEQHAGLPPYQCTHEGCQMRFTFPNRLRRHEKVHKGYPCKEEGCSFSGKTWTDYLKHRKEQHRPVHKCDQCSMVFRDSWSLRQHQQVHSKTRVVFRCPRKDCDRSFTKMSNLECHISSFHEGLQPFTCPHPGCGKTFAFRQSLQRHSSSHNPEKTEKPKKPRPRRSLASKLSGFKEKKKSVRRGKKEPEYNGQTPQVDAAGSVELVSLLQDTALLCNPAVDTHELSAALAAPLSV